MFDLFNHTRICYHSAAKMYMISLQKNVLPYFSVSFCGGSNNFKAQFTVGSGNFKAQVTIFKKAVKLITYLFTCLSLHSLAQSKYVHHLIHLIHHSLSYSLPHSFLHSLAGSHSFTLYWFSVGSIEIIFFNKFLWNFQKIWKILF